MSELEDIFNELGISNYLHDFVEQGFDTWETILDITESDFDALGVKLGHRRKLQRKIANSRGLSSDRALHSPRHTPSDDQPAEEQKVGVAKGDGKDAGSGSQGAKRKYRRHPKPDDNAPERPPSAYVIFSNKMREDLKGRNLSFTEIAKLVGENWQSLSASEKELYEQQAFTAKERYNSELAEYKKTDQYRDYSSYLAEFKAKQSNLQHSNDVEAAKKPKLEARESATSSGTGSSIASARIEQPSSSTLSTVSWLQSDFQRSPEAVPMPKVGTPVLAGLTKSQDSPTATPPGALPGYRDSLYANTLHPTLAWRDIERDEKSTPVQHLPRISSIDDRRSMDSRMDSRATPSADLPGFTSSVQHSRRLMHGQAAPPLLTSESTATSSSTSSTYFSPRTPMETLDRALPIPTPYIQKSTPNFENQLPPLRPLSPSFQTGSVTGQNSPSTVHNLPELPNTMPPMRSFAGWPPYGAPSDQYDHRKQEHVPANAAEDSYLDPVSALLKAGEIVNRNNQDRPGT